jgi:hypothetical protein
MAKKWRCTNKVAKQNLQFFFLSHFCLGFWEVVKLRELSTKCTPVYPISYICTHVVEQQNTQVIVEDAYYVQKKS